MKSHSLEIMPVDSRQHAKMHFIDNALTNGWSVRKRGEKYVFRKKHKGETRVFKESFLTEFINEQLEFIGTN